MLAYSVITLFIANTIEWKALLIIVGLYCVTHGYFKHKINNKLVIIAMNIVIVITGLSLLSHAIPWFHKVILLDAAKISENSSPFSMYLNIDKVIAGIILFINIGLYKDERIPDFKAIIWTIGLLIFCTVFLMSLGMLSGYIRFDFKIPEVLLIWCLINLFFVCFAEEVIFRGVIQNYLMQLFAHKYLSLAISSLIFGLMHFKGGVVYIILASIAGFFYGLTYQKTNRISCAIFMHFGFNLMHIIFFTYPSAIKIVS